MTRKKAAEDVLSAATLLSQTSGRRRVAAVPEKLWKCEYCGANFKHETAFMKHSCRPMERTQEMKSPDGQAAYHYYGEWFRLQGRKCPSVDAFKTSSKYNAFKNFVEFSRRVSMPNPVAYLRFMIDSEISPTLWCRPASYSLYLTHVENNIDPISAVQDTIRFLCAESGKIDLAPNEIFEAMTLTDMALLCQRRLISPYFLIYSTRFRSVLSAATKDEQSKFIAQVPLNHWASRLIDNPAIAEKIKHLVKEIGV